MQRTWATHFEVARASWANFEEIATQSQFTPAFFALCTFAALSLLLDLNGLFHCSANLLLRAVVVVDKVLVLDLERRLDGERLELAFCCLERGHFLVPSDD